MDPGHSGGSAKGPERWVIGVITPRKSLVSPSASFHLTPITILTLPPPRRLKSMNHHDAPHAQAKQGIFEGMRCRSLSGACRWLEENREALIEEQGRFRFNSWLSYFHWQPFLPKPSLLIHIKSLTFLAHESVSTRSGLFSIESLLCFAFFII